jgi:hypothetical protein
MQGLQNQNYLGIRGTLAEEYKHLPQSNKPTGAKASPNVAKEIP